MKKFSLGLSYEDITKLILKMKLTFLLIILLVSGAFATNAVSQVAKVSLLMNGVPISQIIEAIESQTDYLFVYNKEEVDVTRNVSISVRNKSVAEVLSSMFRNTDIIYAMEGSNIMLMTEESAAAQQNLQVTGKVTDSSGQPLPGVTVLVKGTTTGTISNSEGTYTLSNVPPDGTLVFSFVGMKSQEIAVAGKKNLDVQMEEESIGIDEVVAIGYANARKQDLSVAVSTVKVGDNFKGRPTTLGSILKGQMTGVSVTESGDPTETANISIRGKGNKNGDAVLYVVDGVPGAPFNPSDIETVTILKDAASAAIYGAYAGSGGVILITTRQAREGKVAISINGWNGIQSAWRLPKVLTSEQYNQIRKDAAAAAGKTVPAVYDPALFPYGNVTRTDWVDEIFRTGRMQHYDVTLQGGSKDLKALASVSYDNTEGTLINTYNEKLTTRLNVDFTLNKWSSVRQKMVYDYSNGKSDIGDGHTGSIFGAMAYTRFSTVYDFDEAGNPLYDDGGNRLYGGTVPRWALAKGISVEADLRNPVAMLEKVIQFNPSNRLFSNTELELKPLAGLSIKSDFSVDLTNTRNESFQKKFLEPGRTIDQNYRRIANTLFKGWIWENIASYSRVFNEKHQLSLVGAFTMIKKTNRYNWTGMRGYAFEEEHYTTFLNGTDWTTDKPQEDIWEESSVSALGRASYSYADRYFLTGSVRRDASSKLSPDNNSDIFSAISGAWKISSESFMENFEPISFLKLRASWGQVGNINSVRRFIYAPPYQMTSWPLFLGETGEKQAFGIFQPTIPNPDLKWERTEQTNLGLDFGFLKNSLNFSVDYFNKRTKDLIESMPVPSVAGVASPPEYNVGEVLNKGWEFTLSYDRKIGDFDFTVSGNCSMLSNEVISIGATKFISHSNNVNSLNPLQSTAGQPWYSYYLIDAMGIFQTQAEIDNYVWTNPSTNVKSKIQPNAKPGDLQFKDANNDGMINDGDRVYMGAYEVPDLSYGFNLEASWKGFSLSMIFQGVAGVKIFNGVKAMTYTGLKGWNMSTDVLRSFNYDPNSGIPRLAVVEDPNGNFSKVSDYFLEKGDYMRLKNLHLSYTLPKTFVAKIGLRNSTFRFYLNGENLLTFTKYSAFDPEVGNLGIDAGRYPVSRMVSLGLNVSF
jgi:TonB-linked SusC/RagA family outer membrane protein